LKDKMLALEKKATSLREKQRGRRMPQLDIRKWSETRHHGQEGGKKTFARFTAQGKKGIMLRKRGGAMLRVEACGSKKQNQG